MTSLPDSAKRFLETGRIGHLATLSSTGRPHVTCAWVGLEGEQLVIGTMFDQRKLRNMRRDPRVTLSFEGDEPNEMGLVPYLIVDGSAEVSEGGGAELLQELAYLYLGPEVGTFPPMPDPPPGFVTRISVERIGGVGPWAD
ncbi:MAG: TIGR03618 family F420-dependent PPOX class oxidoreductase [Actinomycetota bacterium]